MIAEEFLSGINANIFLREFSFNKNKFNLNPQEEVQFADHVIWIDDLLLIFQLKERESDIDSTNTNDARWFKKKVLGKATKQIRDSLNYLNKQNNIPIKNQWDDLFVLNPQDISTIIKIVVYLSPENPSEELKNIKYHKSSTAGFIHVLPMSDYFGICSTLFTPTEIKKYFLFREKLFTDWSQETKVFESAIVGQFLYGEFDACPSNQYLQYYKAFINKVDEFNINDFLQQFREHIDHVVGSLERNDYYRILAEFSKLTRTELSEVKARILLCLDAARDNVFKKPYRLIAPTTGCGFVFVPLTQDLVEYRITGLQNLTFAAKYDRQLTKCVGMSFGYENNQFLIDWAYTDFPWEFDQELENLLKDKTPFRPLKYAEKPPYFFNPDKLEKLSDE